MADFSLMMSQMERLRSPVDGESYVVALLPFIVFNSGYEKRDQNI